MEKEKPNKNSEMYVKRYLLSYCLQANLRTSPPSHNCTVHVNGWGLCLNFGPKWQLYSQVLAIPTSVQPTNFVNEENKH